MTKPTRPPLSDQERAERRRRDRELMQQVEELRSSAGWRNWLQVRSSTVLARYSLLISGRFRQ